MKTRDSRLERLETELADGDDRLLSALGDRPAGGVLATLHIGELAVLAGSGVDSIAEAFEAGLDCPGIQFKKAERGDFERIVGLALHRYDGLTDAERAQLVRLEVSSQMDDFARAHGWW